MKRYLIILFILLSFTVKSAITDGIVAYYPMNERTGTNINDTVGNNDGTATSCTINQAGKLDRTISFNGTSSYITLPNVSDLQMESSDFTFIAWIKISSYPSMNPIIGSNTGGFNIRIGSTGKISIGGPNSTAASSDDIISLNTFTFIGVVKTGGNVTYYINSASSQKSFTDNATSGVPFEAIGRYNPMSVYFAGYIDEVGIWKRALTSTEIAQIYNNGDGNPYPFTVESPTIQKIVYTDFEDLAIGTFPSAIRDSLNLVIGQWDDANINIVDFEGEKALELYVPAGTIYTPLLNTRSLFDSLYREVWFTARLWYPTNFDFGGLIPSASGGGKLFNSFIGGPPTAIPYGANLNDYYFGDSLQNAWNSLFLWNRQKSYTYYCYTNTPNHPGATPSSVNDRPTDATNFTAWNNGDGWAIGKDYAWNWGNTSYYGTEPWAWPALTEWDGSRWIFTSYSMPAVPQGQWVNITSRFVMNHKNVADGIVELYMNNICVFTKSDIIWVRANGLPTGAEAMYLNHFYGGGANDAPIIDSYLRVGDMGSWYHKPNDPDFDTTAHAYGDTVIMPTFSGHKYVNTPGKTTSNTFTDASGVVYSHNRNFNVMMFNKRSNNILEVSGATSYVLTLSDINIRLGTSNGCNACNDSLRVFTWSGSAWNTTPTIRRGGANGNSPGTFTLTTTKVLIQYFSGSSYEYPRWPIGWTINYTSNGTGSGENPTYATASQLIAPQWRSYQGTTPPPDTTYSDWDSLKINFTNSLNLAGAGWNDLTDPAQGVTYNNLVNNLDQHTDISLGISTDGFLSGGWGDSTTTEIPKKASKYTWWWGADNGSGDSVQSIYIQGLISSEVYNINIYGSRLSGGGDIKVMANGSEGSQNVKLVEFSTTDNTTMYRLSNITNLSAWGYGGVLLVINFQRYCDYGHINAIIITKKVPVWNTWRVGGYNYKFNTFD